MRQTLFMMCNHGFVGVSFGSSEEPRHKLSHTSSRPLCGQHCNYGRSKETPRVQRRAGGKPKGDFSEGGAESKSEGFVTHPPRES